MSNKVLLAVFLGGALGSLSRYLVSLTTSSLPDGYRQLAAVSIVNLLGAALLGFVVATALIRTFEAKAFWGTGFAGGFTTMSGVAMILASPDQGLSEAWLIFWLAILLQIIFGLVLYIAGARIAKRLGEKK